jgi:Pentapeptide repeats (8 copies)
LAYDSNHAKLWQDVKADLDKLRARAGKFAADAEWAFGSRTARVLGVLVLFAVVVTLLLVFLNWYVAPTKPSDKKDLVLALAQILAGTALLSGLYFTWRTLQVNRKGQITDRFTRAIDQLGATDNEGDKLFEIRIGGIYALERIAKESEEDYWSIVEILIAYVRQHARWPPEEGQGSEADSAVEDDSVEDSRSSESESTEVPPPSPDIQAIMTVLRRRTGFFGHGEPESLDLRSTHLREANLTGANLQGADLTGAHLWKADLQGAKLRGADLQEAILLGVDLQGANLYGADLQGAILYEAEVTDAQLADTRSLHGAIMPIGQKYEDWLKDKEGRGKDGENQ